MGASRLRVKAVDVKLSIVLWQFFLVVFPFFFLIVLVSVISVILAATVSLI